VRAVLDPNVLISALLSRSGSPARVLRAWLEGAFELVVSDLLLAELERALGYPKLRTRVTASETAELLELLRRGAQVLDDPDEEPSVHSSDPGDDYLIVLAETAHAVIVSGDHHLLHLADRLPVLSSPEFLAELGDRS
jgi:putative PIN family toxin of toxin-antitoxin system